LLLIKNILFGLLSWFIPFAISLIFNKHEGDLIVFYTTFKSIIMVLGVTIVFYLLFRYYKLVDEGFINSIVTVGIFWFIINIFLDAVFLILMKYP
jgi:hypothetical protein